MAALIPIVSWLALDAVAGILLTISNRRFLALPALLIPATISLKTLHYLDFCSGLPEVWGLLTLGGLIHFSSLLYVKNWAFRGAQRSPDASRTDFAWLHPKHWAQLYKLAVNPRFIKVPYEDVTGIRSKSTAIHASFTPSRIFRLLVKIAVHQTLNALVINEILGGVGINDFTPHKATSLRRLRNYHADASFASLSRAILIRIWFAATSIWTAILILDCLHAGTAVVFIYVLHTDSPDEWPDLFGSTREAYTVGRFWSRAWHRIHLSGYRDYATLLLPQAVLRNAPTKRVSMIFAIFLFSGLIHQITSLQLHPECIDFADLQFFSLNAAIVCLEAGVMQVVSKWGLRKRGQSQQAGERISPSKDGPLLVRCCGYIWVVACFAWASAKCYYPRVQCMLVQNAHP